MSLDQIDPATVVHLMCPSHPNKMWWTSPGNPTIHFAGERHKKNHHGLIPPFKAAVKEVVSGRALKRDEPLDFTPADLRRVCEAYQQIEDEYAFECDCPTESLVRRPLEQ